MAEIKHLTEDLFEEVLEKCSPIQLELLFIKLYGILERSEIRGESRVAEEAKEEITGFLERIRKREAKRCES